MKTIFPATLLCDFYKVSHKDQYPKGTTHVYSTWTPRGTRVKDVNAVVAFGIQSFAIKYLVQYFNRHFFNRSKAEVVSEYKRFIKFTLGVENPDASHIEELHDLGFLPLEVKAVKEGTLVPVKVPMLTVENTHPNFGWLTNYFETIISTEIWQPMTSATLAFRYRQILERFAEETGANKADVLFQAHDFSMRGMANLESAAASGAGHLLSFTGTDTIPAIAYLEEYYNANIEYELVGASIPATEHSVMSANADEDRNEFNTFKRLITEVYPNGFVSIVSDTYDFWKVIGEIIPALKQDILNRDGRVVIRPDSGDPVEILCGEFIEDVTNEVYVSSLEDAKDYFYEKLMDKLRDETPHGEHGDSEVVGRFKYNGKYYELEIEVEYNRYDKQYYFIEDHKQTRFEEFTPSLQDLGLIEALWNIFGGTVNKKGFKQLDSHIGAIYGDSITLDRATQILERLKAKGFASTNVVLGIGSFTYQYNTRDTFMFAMKATHTRANGVEKLIFKDPKTDSGMKRSQRGRVVVTKTDEGYTYLDGLNVQQQADLLTVDELETVFLNGQIMRKQSLSDIRARVLENLK